MSTLTILLIIGAFIIVQVIVLGRQKGELVASTKEALQEGLKLVVEKNTEERERMTEIVESRLKLGEKELNSKKDLILEAVNKMSAEVNRSQDKLIQSDASRITEFQTLRTIIDQHKTATESLRATADNLRKILSNNQLRGSFGQEVAEDLLKVAGFVKGQNYTAQVQQETSSNKPDFTVVLPDGTKVNIDVKFPFQALQRWQETEDIEQQKKYLAEFKGDIKAKIKEVTTRNYISPEENTVDFVIMFIPNEMIFSFIYEKFPDVWQEAIKEKVVMCGPFGFTAILRMVQQSYQNFKYQKNLHNIVALIKNFEVEYGKFSKSLDVLGDKIQSVSKEYESVSGVRDRKLTKVIDKIISDDSLPMLGTVEHELLEKPMVETG